MSIVLHEEMKKQTEHLRAIRNWVAAIGIIVVVVPIIVVVLFMIFPQLLFLTEF